MNRPPIHRRFLLVLVIHAAAVESAAAALLVYEPFEYDAGTVLHGTAAGGERLDLVGYDKAETIMLPAGFDPSDPNAQFTYELSGLDVDFEKITSITFRIRANDNNFIDELRIGRTYGDVIPEPGTAILAWLGGSVWFLRHGVRRRAWR